MVELSWMTMEHATGALTGILVGVAVTFIWHWGKALQRRNTAKRYDVSDPVNQLRFVEEGSFQKRRPINKEAYFNVFSLVERHLVSTKADHRLLAEVSMGSFLKTPYEETGPSKVAQRAFASINSKRVDFLLIDRFGMPVLVIEYLGSGHFQGNAEMRDIVKLKALEDAGIPCMYVFPETPPESLIQSLKMHKIIN